MVPIIYLSFVGFRILAEWRRNRVGIGHRLDEFRLGNPTEKNKHFTVCRIGLGSWSCFVFLKLSFPGVRLGNVILLDKDGGNSDQYCNCIRYYVFCLYCIR